LDHDEDMKATEPRHPQTDPANLGEQAGYPIYAMPMFVTVAAANVSRTVDFFVRSLDFGAVFIAPESGGIVPLAHLRRAKYQDVLVVPARSVPQPGTSLLVTFAAADADEIDALAARVAATAPSAAAAPIDTAWNTRDLNVVDPDGNRLVFTARARRPTNPGLGEMLRGADPSDH
jgi:catechol 2,3-dioxygenase-like lactoylglutathione lyase family enzyme